MLDKVVNFFKGFQAKRFKKDVNTRIALYRIIVSSLTFKNTIKQAISKRRAKLIKRHEEKSIKIGAPAPKEMPFLNHVNDELLAGETFANATNGWITPNEYMLLEAGSSKDLKASIQMALTLLEKLKKLKSEVIKCMTYPIVLMFAFFGILFGFAFEIIPLLESISNPDDWGSSELALYDFSIFFRDNFHILFLSLLTLSIVIAKTLPRWTGVHRDKINKIFPYSLYKELNAGIFLISLSTLIEAGNTPLQALQKLRAGATKYMQYEIDKMITLLNEANNPARAINTGFLGEVGDDIEDIAENGNFEEILKVYGEEAISKIINSIVKKADIVKYLLMTSIVFFLMWGYSAFTTISQSITTVSGV